MTASVTLERLGSTAIVTLSHPPANLLTVENLQALSAQLTALEADASVMGLVLTGSGETFFSAGLALTLLAQHDRPQAEALLDALVTVSRQLRAFHGLAVAAVNGFAFGAGLEIALSCHVVIAERGAALGMPQARVGLIAAAGGIKLLSDKIGPAWTRRMVLTGETVDAQRAGQIGLVEEVVDPGFAKIVAISLADKVARQAPRAAALARELIDASARSTFDTHLEQARQAFFQLVGSEDQLQGVQAFLDKRAPPWCEDDD